MWAPKAMLMVPSAFTVSAWHPEQDAASWPPTLGCPVGGMAWQDPQVSGVVSGQAGAARVPVTVPMVKLPWQETLLQVFDDGSKVAPAWWTDGFWEKSTTNPVGAWQPAQVTEGPIEPATRWVWWFVPCGTTPDAVPSVLAPWHPRTTEERRTTAEPVRKWSARIAPSVVRDSRYF